MVVIWTNTAKTQLNDFITHSRYGKIHVSQDLTEINRLLKQILN